MARRSGEVTTPRLVFSICLGFRPVPTILRTTLRRVGHSRFASCVAQEAQRNSYTKLIQIGQRSRSVLRVYLNIRTAYQTRPHRGDPS